MQSWIQKQSEHNVSQFDISLTDNYPYDSDYFRNPEAYFKGITQLWNYLDAAKLINWDEYLVKDSIVVDLAGGPGWLSSFLSNNANIAKIYNVDSCRYFLTSMMPELVKKMGGINSKIEPVEGLFTPLLFEDNSIDLVAVSSSLHHADNLEDSLKEIYRTLKPGATLVILNEGPLNTFQYIGLSFTLFIITLKDAIIKKYKHKAPKLSSAGILYDHLLGDLCYPLWYWEEAIKRSGFKLEKIMNTGLFTKKSDKKGIQLVNFICRK